MKKKAHIVIGLGYGDEGKGSATNYLCGNSLNPIVIRFNGGHQAGHTVMSNSGSKHVFSSFGSGTLQSIPTYWSNYCTVSPAHLLAEFEDLKVCPKLYIDAFCPITTHYDVLYNRALETTKGDKRFGSCGVGFGATIDRHNKIKFLFKDCFDPTIVNEHLKNIREYYREKINLETDYDFSQFEHEIADKDFRTDSKNIIDLSNNEVIIIANEEDIFKNDNWATYIFEGAQGILLDQSFGTKPHITKSNTSSKNALNLLHKNFRNEIQQIDINLHYISRCYLTRHGAGPFPTHEEPINLINFENETNVYNEYQGELRTGYLNIDLLNYALDCDNMYSSGLTKHLIITCLDQISSSNLTVYMDGKLQSLDVEKIPYLLKNRFRSTTLSYSPNMKEIKEIKYSIPLSNISPKKPHENPFKLD